MNKKVIGLTLVLAGLTSSTAFNRTIFFDADNFFNTFFERADRNAIQSPTIKEISKPGADRYVYQLNAPGFAEEDLEIKFNETLNLISISAKSSSQTDTDDTDEDAVRHTHSSSSQSFSTSFTAPSDALLSSLEYSVDKGQVTLIMEKVGPALKKGWQSVTAKKIKA